MAVHHLPALNLPTMNYGRNASRLLRTIHSAAVTVAPVPVPAPIPTPTRGQAHHIPYPPHAFSLDLHEKVEYLRNVSLQATEVEVSQPQVTHSDAELHALYADVLNVGPEEPCTDRSIKGIRSLSPTRTVTYAFTRFTDGRPH